MGNHGLCIMIRACRVVGTAEQLLMRGKKV